MNEKSEKLKGEFVFEGAQLSLENAENHFEAGEILAGKDKFGLATSHIILAAEECAKSIMLFVKYNEADNKKSDAPIDSKKIAKIFDEYDFNKLFYSHKPKQNLALLISIFGQIIAELSPWPISVINEIIFGEGKISQEDEDKIIEKRNKQEKRIKDWKHHSIIPDLGLKKNSDWWKQVNENKNSGLYVGLKNGKWKTPQDFTKEDYQIGHDNVSGMIALLNRYLEAQATIDAYVES